MDLLGLVPPKDDVLYVGHRDTRGNGTVAIETLAGEPLGDLPNVPKGRERWPGSVEWGYGGEGPHDLTRSLLLHALGNAAVCHTCGGTGGMRVRSDPTAPEGYVIETYARGDEPPGDARVLCPNHTGCEYGMTTLPIHEFVEAYVRHWPTHGAGIQWRLTRREILTWLAAQTGPLAAGDEGLPAS